jgi:hypothetical protein
VLLAGGAGAALVPDRAAVDALARDHGVSRTTGYHYLDEVIEVLAAEAPELPGALARALPGSIHDVTAAHALPALYRAAALGLPALADPGYQGAGIGIRIPVKQPEDSRELDLGNRTRSALQRFLRCPGERGFALLTQRWRTLQHITASPSKITAIARAALVLTQYEHGYIK